MPDYESIFACRDRRGRRGRYWLRLYPRGGGTVAIVSEVKGNVGPSVTRAAEQIATALVERFSLDPHNLVVIEHYPPDSVKTISDGQDHFTLLTLLWQTNRYTIQERTDLAPRDVSVFLGRAIPHGLTFWQPAERVDSYICRVGERSATVVRTAVRDWHALITRNDKHAILRRGFATKNQAMCAALDTLANFAAEYDLWPVQTRG
jgi:hypothetical protein